MSNIRNQFNIARVDILEAWNNPIDKSMKLNRTWINQVDPETMIFVKALYKLVDGSNSLYSTFCLIMKYETLDKLLLTECKNYNYGRV